MFGVFVFYKNTRTGKFELLDTHRFVDPDKAQFKFATECETTGRHCAARGEKGDEYWINLSFGAEDPSDKSWIENEQLRSVSFKVDHG